MFQVFQGFLKKLQSEQHVLDIWILSTKLALQDFMWAIELDLLPCGNVQSATKWLANQKTSPLVQHILPIHFQSNFFVKGNNHRMWKPFWLKDFLEMHLEQCCSQNIAFVQEPWCFYSKGKWHLGKFSITTAEKDTMNVTWTGVQLLDTLSTQSMHKIEHNLRIFIKQYVYTIRPSILIVTDSAFWISEFSRDLLPTHKRHL